MSSNRFVRVLPFVLFTLLVLAALPSILYDSQSEAPVRPSDVVWMLGFLAFPIVGVGLARRFPRNAVGWLFVVGPTLTVLGVGILEYSQAVDSTTIEGVGENLFSMGLVAIGSAMLVFPDGRYPNRLLMALHVLLLTGLLVVANETADGVMLVGVALLPVAGIVYRLIQGDGEARRQLKPLLFVVALGLFALFVVAPLIPDSSDPSLEVPLWVPWVEVMFFWILSVGVPIAIAVSITRYRLYEIDRIISRTISYALVAGSLGLIFAAGAVWVPTALDLNDPLFVAASTLVVAAMFNPVRKRVQGWVDRRFNRSKYDAQHVIDEFTGSLQDQIDSDDLVNGWIGVVSDTMEPSGVSVWVKGS